MKKFLALSITAHCAVAALLAGLGRNEPATDLGAKPARLAISFAAATQPAIKKAAAVAAVPGKARPAAPVRKASTAKEAPSPAALAPGGVQAVGQAGAQGVGEKTATAPADLAERLVQDMWADAVAQLLQQRGIQFFRKEPGKAAVTITANANGELVSYSVSGDPSAKEMAGALVQSIRSWPRFIAPAGTTRTFSRNVVFRLS